MSEYEQEILQLQITDQPMTLEIRRSRGGRGSGPHLENHKKNSFLAIMNRIPWKATKPAFNVRPFCSIWILSALIKNQQLVRLWPHLTKLSGSAHARRDTGTPTNSST